jgi:hypothetical protein
MLFGMPKTPKVVPLDQSKSRVIAADEKTNRVIIAIGRQRIAFDLTTRITHLPPNTGDHPAAVLPLQSREADPGDHPLAGTPNRGRPSAGSRRKRPGERKNPTGRQGPLIG